MGVGFLDRDGAVLRFRIFSVARAQGLVRVGLCRDLGRVLDRLERGAVRQNSEFRIQELGIGRRER